MMQRHNLAAQSVLEFNQSVDQEMRKICSPLQQFGILSFTYVRFFNGGNRLYLCTTPGWVKLYMENKLYDVVEHAEHYVPQADVRYSFWTGFKKNKVFDVMNACNLGNGFTIYERHAEYVDYFDFTAKKENVGINNFYLNNLWLLEAFVKDFKNKAAHIIKSADKNALIVPEKKIFFPEIQYDSFIDDSKIRKFIREVSFKPHLSS